MKSRSTTPTPREADASFPGDARQKEALERDYGDEHGGYLIDPVPGDPRQPSEAKVPPAPERRR